MPIKPLLTVPCLAISAMVGSASAAHAGTSTGITLEPLGRYSEETAPGTGVCRRNISEIGAYDPLTRRLFVTNYADDAVDVFDIRDPQSLVRIVRIKLSELPGLEDPNLSPTSVAVRFPLVAVAAESIDPLTAPGKLLILGINGRLLRGFDVGSGADMVTFTPDGRHVLAAVEGEPDPSGSPDPEGSIAILDLRHGAYRAELHIADFSDFNGTEDLLRAKEIRVTPGVAAASDMEPEYIAVARDSLTAWVTLQENNALAKVDIDGAKVRNILALGVKDHAQQGAGFDASRDDGDAPASYPTSTPSGINIVPWPVWGAYQPDGIASYRANGHDFVVTANEGDARNGDGDIVEVENRSLATNAFPNAETLMGRPQLGRLEVSNLPQDLRPDGAGEATRMVAFGGRSFSIWDRSGHQVYDSGEQFEQITAHATPSLSNTQDDDNEFDRRSPRRGPEPEGIAVGQVLGRTYAFIGLERHSGIMVYDVTNPQAAEFDGYFNARVFPNDPNQLDPSADELDKDVINCAAGDLGPEGMLFIPALLSPNFKPLLVVSYETSGSTRIWQINQQR